MSAIELIRGLRGATFDKSAEAKADWPGFFERSISIENFAIESGAIRFELLIPTSL